MEITEVKVTPVNDGGRHKAHVVIKFDDCFVVRGLRLIEGRHRWFVAMPDKKVKDGSYMDIAYPLGTQFRDHLEAVVMAEYNKVVANLPLSQKGQGKTPSPLGAKDKRGAHVGEGWGEGGFAA